LVVPIAIGIVLLVVLVVPITIGIVVLVVPIAIGIVVQVVLVVPKAISMVILVGAMSLVTGFTLIVNCKKFTKNIHFYPENDCWRGI